MRNRGEKLSILLALLVGAVLFYFAFRDVPFGELPDEQKRSILEGDSGYYGIRGFFKWLETKTYKMHVRVYLSRYRTTVPCPDCGGARFKPESLLYKLGGLNIASRLRLCLYV